jgi:phage tail-like protein
VDPADFDDRTDPSDTAPAVAWSAERAALTLWQHVFQRKSTQSQVLEPAMRRGAGRDRYGNWYWIDDGEARILIKSSGSGTTGVFWAGADAEADLSTKPVAGTFFPLDPAPAPQPRVLRGLAVTAHHYLVVGLKGDLVNPPGLLVFDLHAGGPPQQILWPADVPFDPFDMSPSPDGGLWILDRTYRAVWALDCHLKIIRHAPRTAVPIDDGFQNLDGSPRVPPRQRVPIAPAVTLSALKTPIAIEALPDGTVLILDQHPDANARSSAIHRFRFDAEIGAPALLEVMQTRVEGAPLDFQLYAHDLAYAGGRVYVASTAMKPPVQPSDEPSGGEQAYAFALTLTDSAFSIDPSPDYLPMRFFGGKGVVAAGDEVFYDYADGWVNLINQPRARYRVASALHTPVFDGKEPGCVWHRLLLDACIPRSARVAIWSRASDERDDLDADRAPWSREPDLVLRAEGPEIPFAPSLSPRPGGTDNGTWELLFQRARGRFLQLRLLLGGDGTTSPELRALRAYYPRFSYLTHYLPGVYREDPESASFLDRFLALFEGFFTSIEDRIAAAQVLLDVRSAPAEALDWLATFFDVALDPAWDDARRRLFIRHAVDFFRFRGTIPGLTMALELAIARCPDERLFDAVASVPSGKPAMVRPDNVRIIEKWRSRLTPGVVLGDPTDLEGIRTVSIEGRWKPDQGRDKLVSDYIAAVAAAFPAPQSPDAPPLPTTFPITRPTDRTGPVWTAFCRRALGFVPSANSDDAKLWRDFLYRAYGGDKAALAAVWGSAATDFDAVPVPSELPVGDRRIGDWYRFEGVLAVRRNAHQFLVVLPVPPTDTGNAETYQERRRLAERIIALEKPAHTVFDVRFYWAMFRVGDARVAIDTQIHRGSRAPELLGPMVLGQHYLAEGYLAPRPPQDATDRDILGRDPIRG